ncbi:uncharacterized protein RCO7_03797 [Rhynchosporium graminicola]|uniref:EthD domain-containing protein n=2 Tax=Rhynchosporium TaxID=38037 RepID=A0A1E1M667_RHYSE|nr:uncharacterized protein RCO7_03797 [Rhynchosporium commune]CZT44593.1 uncharacterized protein RSE6_04784 [Rhynchosporium secalis]
MTFILTLLYPKGSKDFDLDYYLNTHMPMVTRAWQNPSDGLRKWQVVKLDPSTGYVTKCILTWDKQESVGKAFGGEDGKKILDDIPNFSETQPERHAGEVVGES